MAGFLFVLDSMNSLEGCIRQGTYSTYITEPSGLQWSDPACMTLGDYATIRPGDNVYFFSKRKIFGIGKVIAPPNSPYGFSMKCSGALIPRKEEIYKKAGVLKKIKTQGGTRKVVQPWEIHFKPSPRFFKIAIDMDEMLESNPSAFRSLRCIHGLSFIKMDDVENDAFKAAFYRRAEGNLGHLDTETESSYKCSGKLPSTGAIRENDVREFVSGHLSSKGNGEFARESHLETALLFDLADSGSSAHGVFGEWDYLSHQVHASPAKPVEYMDKIDVFGYRLIKDVPNGDRPVVSKYLVVELKKGEASPADVLQAMRYADWVCKQYANGDYSQVEAFLVAQRFSKNSLTATGNNSERYYMRAKEQKKLVWNSVPWSGLHLVRYEVKKDGRVTYSTVSCDSDTDNQ